jgi:hypothetical protein
MTFFIIPKVFFEEIKYQNMSIHAMVLYGILYDRTKLSIENDWFDEKGRAFIYYTREDVQKMLKIKNDKSISLFKELRKYDLIDEVRQGQNMPNIIYVGKFKMSTISTSPNPSPSRTSEKSRSGGRKNRGQDIGKIDSNYNYNNNNKRVYKTFNNFTNRTYDAKTIEEQILEASKNDLIDV